MKNNKQDLSCNDPAFAGERDLKIAISKTLKMALKWNSFIKPFQWLKRAELIRSSCEPLKRFSGKKMFLNLFKVTLN
jgi:hypothetical protein